MYLGTSHPELRPPQVREAGGAGMVSVGASARVWAQVWVWVQVRVQVQVQVRVQVRVRV